MSQPHKCHALHCQTPVRRCYLMCFKHWAMVPLDIKRAVWMSYRRRQYITGPSREWVMAAKAAVRAVAAQEGHDGFLQVDEFFDGLLAYRQRSQTKGETA